MDRLGRLYFRVIIQKSSARIVPYSDVCSDAQQTDWNNGQRGFLGQPRKVLGDLRI